MNEILEKLLKILPAYLSDLFAITISPKKFLNTRNLKDNKILEQSALFFAISLALTFLLQTPLLPINQNPLYLFVELLIIEIILVFLMAVVLRFSWFVVGGKANLMALFIYCLYISGPMTLIFVAFSLLGDTSFRLFDPQGYLLNKKIAASVGQVGSAEITTTPELLNILNIFLLLGLAAVYGWLTIAWGAFRQINLTTRLKSFIAYLLFNILLIPLYGVALILAIYLWLPPSQLVN